MNIIHIPEFVEHTLINFLLIIAAIFTKNLMFENKPIDKSTNLFPYPNIFLISILMFLMILFSYPVTETLNFDLRAIPYILGGLYGGPFVIFILFVVSLISKIIILGADRLVLNILSFILVGGITYLVSLKYLSFSFKWKLVAVSSLATLDSLIIFSLRFFLENELTFYWWSIIAISQTIIAISITYIIEKHYEKRILQSKVFQSERRELINHLGASIAHEVRNGMTTTKGFIQLLRETQLEDTQEKYCDIALQELQRTEQIISNYLNLAKPTSIHTQTLDMDQIMEEIKTVIQPLANQYSVLIRTEITPFQIRGEKNAVQQAFLNIAKNAIEAMPNGGILSLKTSILKDQGVITIKDNGVGMSVQQISRLGTPYYSTKEQKGTGLGLMTTFHIIEGMDGSIHVCSKLKEGSTFNISIPLSNTRNTLIDI